MLEDPWAAPPEEPYALTSSPADAPLRHRDRDRLRAGRAACRSTAVQLGLADLIAALNVRAGVYGIGRIDMIENRAVGIKSREVYEAPAAIALIEAHKALEDLVLTKDELRTKRVLETRWTELVYDGLWFSRLRGSIDAFVDSTQEVVTGEVRVGCSRAPRSSPAGARSTRSTSGVARVVCGQRDVPARGGRGLHQDQLARDGAPRSTGARHRGRVTWEHRHTIGTVQAQTRHTSPGSVQRSGWWFVPTPSKKEGWGPSFTRDRQQGGPGR